MDRVADLDKMEVLVPKVTEVMRVRMVNQVYPERMVHRDWMALMASMVL